LLNLRESGTNISGPAKGLRRSSLLGVIPGEHQACGAEECRDGARAVRVGRAPIRVRLCPPRAGTLAGTRIACEHDSGGSIERSGLRGRYSWVTAQGILNLDTVYPRSQMA